MPVINYTSSLGCKLGLCSDWFDLIHQAPTAIRTMPAVVVVVVLDVCVTVVVDSRIHSASMLINLARLLQRPSRLP